VVVIVVIASAPRSLHSLFPTRFGQGSVKAISVQLSCMPITVFEIKGIPGKGMRAEMEGELWPRFRQLSERLDSLRDEHQLVVQNYIQQ
jgi:hypothetical protein